MGSDERHHSGTGQIAQRLSTLVGANDVGARPAPAVLPQRGQSSHIARLLVSCAAILHSCPSNLGTTSADIPLMNGQQSEVPTPTSTSAPSRSARPRQTLREQETGSEGAKRMWMIELRVVYLGQPGPIARRVSRKATGHRGWTRFLIAGLRYAQATGTWTLYWRGRRLPTFTTMATRLARTGPGLRISPPRSPGCRPSVQLTGRNSRQRPVRATPGPVEPRPPGSTAGQPGTTER